MAEPFTSWNSYAAFERSVRHESRFLHGEPVRQFLTAITECVEGHVAELEKGKALWRAQRGCDDREVKEDGYVFEVPEPFKPERMKPLRHGAIEGRANPKGIPYLYTASNKETAIAEIRPLLNDFVSVAQMSMERDLRLVDCTGGGEGNLDFWTEEPDPPEREAVVWRQIGRAYSNPVTGNPSSPEYIPTQILAEHFKSLGFDGITYRSKLGNGYNVTVFDIDVLHVDWCILHVVTGIIYETRVY